MLRFNFLSEISGMEVDCVKKVFFYIFLESFILMIAPQIFAWIPEVGVPGNILYGTIGTGIPGHLLEIIIYILLAAGAILIFSSCPPVKSMNSKSKAAYVMFLVFTGLMMTYPIMCLMFGGLFFNLMSQTRLYIFLSGSFGICRFAIPFTALLLGGLGKPGYKAERTCEEE